MNKKYAYFFVSLLFFSAEMTSSNRVDQKQAIDSACEYKPGTFTEQIFFVVEQLTENAAVCYQHLQAQYGTYAQKLKSFGLAQAENLQSEDNSCVKNRKDFSTSAYTTIKKTEPLTHLKKYTPDIRLTKQQKYIVAATVACFMTLGFMYRYNRHVSLKDADITTEDIQKLVESVIFNSSIAKQDKLSAIFELLMSHGFENIVVYNDHLFEINDHYKVEMKDRFVKVTRS